MKTFVSMILLVSTLLLCVSCTPDTPASTNDAPAAATTSKLAVDNGPRHYEIDLNMDNYQTYLDFSVEKIMGQSYNGYNTYTVEIDNCHTVAGVLTYAYYEDVILTYDVTYSHNTIVYKGEYSITLNAAGNGEFYTSDQALLEAVKYPESYEARYVNERLTLKSVSGKVIFNV